MGVKSKPLAFEVGHQYVNVRVTVLPAEISEARNVNSNSTKNMGTPLWPTHVCCRIIAYQSDYMRYGRPQYGIKSSFSAPVGSCQRAESGNVTTHVSDSAGPI